MFGTYQRLNVSVAARPSTVIRAAAAKLKKRYRLSTDPDIKAARHRFYWSMLGYHANARLLFRRIARGI